MKNINTLIKGKKRWELLYDYVTTLTPGDFISHQKIETIILTPYKNAMTGTTASLYGSVVAKAIKELTKTQKRLISVRGQGYKVMLAHEYVYDAASNYSRAYRSINKTLFILNNTPLTRLTAQELKTYNDLVSYAKLTENFMAGKNSTAQSIISAAKKIQQSTTSKKRPTVIKTKKP